MIKTALVLIAFGAACAFAQATAQPQTTSVWQYGMPQHRLAIQNTAPWKCRLVTVAPFKGKTQVVGLTDLAPGETMFAGRKGKGGLVIPFSKPALIGYDRSSDLNIPVVAIYFSEADGGSHYIGAASGIFYIPGAGNTSISQLVFGQENIRFANDTPTNAPTVESHLAEKGVVIPYFATEGTAIQIFVWNSRTPARITVNGSGSDELLLGNVKAFVGRSPITVTVSAVDENGKVRTWSQGFQNSDFYGTHAQVFILGMRDLR
jgi:hypothetical protein